MGNCCLKGEPERPQPARKREEDTHTVPVSIDRQNSNKEITTTEGSGARYRKRRSGKQTSDTGNGVPRGSEGTDDSGAEELRDEEEPRWNFPPTLDDFNLMECEEDPAKLEEIFADQRLVEIQVRLSQNQGLGLTIVGGRGSQNGDIPIYVKRILPSSVLEADGKLKSGDELIAVNEILLVNVTKEYASNVLTNVQGEVRLLALQDL